MVDALLQFTSDCASIFKLSKSKKRQTAALDHAASGMPSVWLAQVCSTDEYELIASSQHYVASAGIQPLLLDTQYRMHPLIAHIPSRLFYAGRLQSGLHNSNMHA